MFINRIFLWLLIILVIISVCGYFYYLLFINKPPAITEGDRSQIHLMPLPAKLKLKDEHFPIGPDFGYLLMGAADPRIVKGAERFIQRLSVITDTDFQPDNSPGMIIRCKVAPGAPGQYAMEDESYELKITHEKIFIESKTPLGTLRAFETLLQLIENQGGGFFFRAAKIQDSPRYPWRGLMLDVCRHWMPKEVILRNLDAMSAVKMNVFHWHLSDDEGFRVESRVFPKLHEIGSNGNYYTQKEIGVSGYCLNLICRGIPKAGSWPIRNWVAGINLNISVQKWETLSP
jgi:hexosaminidase